VIEGLKVLVKDVVCGIGGGVRWDTLYGQLPGGEFRPSARRVVGLPSSKSPKKYLREPRFGAHIVGRFFEERRGGDSPRVFEKPRVSKGKGPHPL